GAGHQERRDDSLPRRRGHPDREADGGGRAPGGALGPERGPGRRHAGRRDVAPRERRRTRGGPPFRRFAGRDPVRARRGDGRGAHGGPGGHAVAFRRHAAGAGGARTRGHFAGGILARRDDRGGGMTPYSDENESEREARLKGVTWDPVAFGARV